MHKEEAKFSGSRETALVGLNLVMDVAEKASDGIPIHTVNVVIGGLRVLLETGSKAHHLYFGCY